MESQIPGENINVQDTYTLTLSGFLHRDLRMHEPLVSSCVTTSVFNKVFDFRFNTLSSTLESRVSFQVLCISWSVLLSIVTVLFPYLEVVLFVRVLSIVYDFWVPKVR